MTTVLVADDEADIRFLYEVWLSRRGYDVRIAIDGEEALSLATEDEEIDVVLLDVMMPKMDGVEVCRRLRAAGRQDLPVIMISALARESDEDAGRQAGADLYLTKPVDPDRIVAALTSVLPA